MIDTADLPKSVVAIERRRLDAGEPAARVHLAGMQFHSYGRADDLGGTVAPRRGDRLRSYYVVAERTETRLVLAFSTSWTKAAALQIGNLRKVLGAERASTLASRAAIWADLTRERSSADVEDDAAIADAFM